MKVEIFYLAGCPHLAMAVCRVQRALREEGISAPIVEVEVRDDAAARAAGFLGSPTIRIEGRDIERAARASRGAGFTCRMYTENGKHSGVPPVEWIRVAAREARGRKIHDESE